jgi:hypothetical protein
MRFQATGCILIALSASAAFAQTPDDIRDLVGARAAGAETQMQARGYTNVGGRQGDDRVWTYWWNPTTRTCVTVSTMEGRYDAITVSPAPDCQAQPGQAATPAGAAPAAQQGEHWFDLGLVCFGEGQRPAAATRYGYTWDYEKGRYVYGNRTELTTQDFDASVTIQFWDNGGRVRLPDKLIPPIHSRGEHGWWELNQVSTNSDTITAEYRLNGLNKPKITIDRRSGRISIRGTGDYAFTGTCDTVNNQERRF